MANLIERELQSLFRMPRFAWYSAWRAFLECSFSLPRRSLDMRGGRGGLWRKNFLPIVNLYGLLLLSDALLLNVFGLDRQASQLFFVAPVQIETVLRAKNAVALCLIALQTLAVLGFVLLIRIHVSLFNVAAGISVSAWSRSF